MCNLKLKNSIFKIFIELFIWNKKTRSKIKARWAKLHLKKHVKYSLKNTVIPEDVSNENSKIIWQYWHQGIENAPKIIQRCIESVKKYHPEYEIRILSFDNIKDFVKIPQKYYDLLEEKKIPIAIFSDVLRLYLLSQYGGIWVDSTIYLTNRIPDEILESDFFVFQKNPKTDAFEDRMSCFFIKAHPDNIWIHLIKNAIESYWKENDYLVHYFIFEHIVTMLSESNESLQVDWNKMKFYSADDTGLLQKKFFETYDEKVFNSITERISIHKLTYKKDNCETNGKTFYDKIIS